MPYQIHVSHSFLCFSSFGKPCCVLRALISHEKLVIFLPIVLAASAEWMYVGTE